MSGKGSQRQGRDKRMVAVMLRSKYLLHKKNRLVKENVLERDILYGDTVKTRPSQYLSQRWNMSEDFVVQERILTLMCTNPLRIHC